MNKNFGGRRIWRKKGTDRWICIPLFTPLSNVIYMIQCTKCINLQYIGETKRCFKDRFNEHRRPIINPFCSYIATAVSRHFLSSGHADDHMTLIPLEQLRTSRDSIRKVREEFLIHRGKTLEPAGLNRRDEM